METRNTDTTRARILVRLREYLLLSRVFSDRGRCEAVGVQIHWRPFLLAPLFKAQQGLSDSPSNVFPEKRRYMWRDMERRCESYGLPFARPSVFPRNGLLAARIACANQTAAWQPAFSRAVFAANFPQGRAI
jgi:2-hydroxychromene-2-carboxylate isomerase